MSMGFLAIISYYITRTDEVTIGLDTISFGHHIFYLLCEIRDQLVFVGLKLPNWVEDNGPLDNTLATMGGTLSLSYTSKTSLVY